MLLTGDTALHGVLQHLSGYAPRAPIGPISTWVTSSGPMLCESSPSSLTSVATGCFGTEGSLSVPACSRKTVTEDLKRERVKWAREVGEGNE